VSSKTATAGATSGRKKSPVLKVFLLASRPYKRLRTITTLKDAVREGSSNLLLHNNHPISCGFPSLIASLHGEVFSIPRSHRLYRRRVFAAGHTNGPFVRHTACASPPRSARSCLRGTSNFLVLTLTDAIFPWRHNSYVVASLRCSKRAVSATEYPSLSVSSIRSSSPFFPTTVDILDSVLIEFTCGDKP